MTRKDIQFIAICVGVAALVVIAAHLLWPPAKTTPEVQISREDVAEYAYIASVNSEVFHQPNCRYAQRIKSKNLAGFKSREEAINSGRRPCEVCNP